MNYYKRFPGDYQRDTGHLSLAEHGVYALLLDHYYSTRAPLPANTDSLYRICKAITSAERKAVMSVADAYFSIRDDGLRHNNRADEEVAKWNARAEINRTVGGLGGRPKKNPNDNPQETQTVSKWEPTENPLQNPESRGRIKNPAAPAFNVDLEADPDPDPDPDSYLIWTAGIDLLGESKRSLMGKLVKTHGRELVARKLGELMAMTDKPRDPAAYFIGVMRKLERRAVC